MTVIFYDNFIPIAESYCRGLDHSGHCRAANDYLVGEEDGPKKVWGGQIHDGGSHRINVRLITEADLKMLKDARRHVGQKKGAGKHLHPQLLDVLIGRLEEHLEWIRTPQGTQRHEEMRVLYERARKRPIAEKVALPLDVVIPESASIALRLFTTRHVPTFAAALGLEEVVVVHDNYEDGGWIVQCSNDWANREAFFDLLRQEKGCFKGADEFFEHVSEARNAFIDAVKLPEEEDAAA